MLSFSEAPLRIKEGLPVSQLVRESGVELKQKGAEWVGLCPFHDEKTPSFSINDRKGVYLCRGCKETGDVISFYMAFNLVEFPQAIRDLAKRLGLAIAPSSDENRQRVGRPRQPKNWDDQVLLRINEVAQTVFRESAKTSATFADALANRGISEKAAEAFGLGYLPESAELATILAASPKLADLSHHQVLLGCQELGLLYKHGEHGPFHGRLIFPITNAGGHVVAFSGRAISSDSGRKYLNSPDSQIFSKSLELYALTPPAFVRDNKELRQYWQSLVSQKEVIVVEGYTDVIALAQCGLRAVASMGTAFTASHVRALVGRANRIRCLFDGDTAGLEATKRAVLAIFPALTDAHRLSASILPAGEDPDSFLKRQGAHDQGSALGAINALSSEAPEDVWWSEHIGQVSRPPTLGDQVVIERAYTKTESYPATPLWQLVIARRVQRLCSYRVRDPAVHRETPPWFGRQFSSRALPVCDMVRLWLGRFYRCPALLPELCSPYRRKWWVNDLLMGQARCDGLTPAIAYLFAADYCLAGAELSDQSGFVSRLLDQGYPAHWVRSWLIEIAGTSFNEPPDDETLSIWRFEWSVWLDSIDSSLQNQLLQAVQSTQ